jgi:hypothetical protein
VSEEAGMAVVEVRNHEREIYESRLQQASEGEEARPSRVVSWPARVARENQIEDHLECYRLLFPGKQVTPCIFADLISEQSAEAQNGYIRDSARCFGLPALLFALPRWSAEELERRVLEGGFAGIKVYPSSWRSPTGTAGSWCCTCRGTNGCATR